MVCLLGYVCVSWNAWLCTEFPSCRLLNFGSNQSPERGCSTLLARTWLPCCEGTIWPMEKQVFLTHFQKDPFIFRKITSKTSYLCYTPGAQAFALPGMAMDNAAPRDFEHSRVLGWPFTIRVLLWSDSPENKDIIWQERERVHIFHALNHAWKSIVWGNMTWTSQHDSWRWKNLLRH